MTVNSKKKIEEELKHLTSIERPKVIQLIEAARSNGDLSENADYDAAKERQGFIEGRIQDLNTKLALAQVIDPSKIQTEKVVFGATVTIINLDDEKQVTYQIVGVDEADTKSGKIGIGSPIARALIGKTQGDEVTVNAPKGPIQYEIVSVSYA